MKNHAKLLNLILNQKNLFPYFISDSLMKCDNSSIVRRLDSLLMENGFKLSKELFVMLSKLNTTKCIDASGIILKNIKEKVGSNVKHVPYFIDFPNNIPDTYEFWFKCLVSYYIFDVSIYGKQLYTYEEMEMLHDKLVPNPKKALKVINLGGTFDEEVKSVFNNLAGSTVPLNKADLANIDILVEYDANLLHNFDCKIRENKAILNAHIITLKQQGKIKIHIKSQFDTVVDVLRCAVALSNGDVSLATNSKLKYFNSYERKQLCVALAAILQDKSKIDDAIRFNEKFKRLAKALKPRKCNFSNVNNFFDIVGGKKSHQSMNNIIHNAMLVGKFGKEHDLTVVIGELAKKPGQLARNIDFILRTGNNNSVYSLIQEFGKVAHNISGRVLISLWQHLANRIDKKSNYRLFVNSKGKSYLKDTDDRTAINPYNAQSIIAIIKNALKEKMKGKEQFQNLLLAHESKFVAVPVSEKNASDGFAVFPRGSAIKLDKITDKSSLRFFIYWHQNNARTDYDLSAASYDSNFSSAGQVSYTRLCSADGSTYHSGDITSAPNGASEFIDIVLSKVSKNVKYIIPSVNRYAGEQFKDTKESFFGYMEREDGKLGFPYEASTVKSKFAVRGTGMAAFPIVFIRGTDGWYAKWLDLYMTSRSDGLAFPQRVEAHMEKSGLMAKSIIETNYVTMGNLVELANEVNPYNANLPIKVVDVLGREATEGREILGLKEFKTLIPE